MHTVQTGENNKQSIKSLLTSRYLTAGSFFSIVVHLLLEPPTAVDLAANLHRSD
jgi:hypothetical protein